MKDENSTKVHLSLVCLKVGNNKNLKTETPKIQTDLRYLIPHFWCICQERVLFSNIKMTQLWHLLTRSQFHFNDQNIFVPVMRCALKGVCNKELICVGQIIQSSMAKYFHNQIIFKSANFFWSIKSDVVVTFSTIPKSHSSTNLFILMTNAL